MSVPLYYWMMSSSGAYFSGPIFLALGLVVTGALVGPPLFFRAYNQPMQRDAQELATYARDHLLTRRD